MLLLLLLLLLLLFLFGGNIDARIHIFSDSSIHRKVLSDRKVSMLISGIALEMIG